MRGLYPLLFLSGAAALSVEVVYSRILHRLLGSSSLAAALVLAAFLGGMGLGAFVAERRLVGRCRPFLGFAVLEAGAAVITVLGSILLFLAPGAFRATGGEIFAALLLVLISAPLGAGFPLLLDGLDDDDRRPLRVRRLYGINALGAGGGALVAGLGLVPRFGEVAAIGVGVAAQLVVAGGVAWIDRTLHRTEREPSDDSTANEIGDALRTGAFFVFVSGFVVFFWEVLWMRILVLTVGSSVYAFATVAASVVIGIGVGSWVFGGRLLAKRGAWVLPLVVLLLLIGGYFAVPELPRAFLFGVRSIGLDPLACGALGAGAIAFAPNFLLGCLFPWFLSTRVRAAGSLYAVNSLGSILGALAAGPLLAGMVPLEATYRLGIAAVLLLLLAGVGLVGVPRVIRVAAPIVVAVALFDAFSSGAREGGNLWPHVKLLSGVYQWDVDALREGSLDESYAGRRMIAVIEGREVIVSAEVDDETNTMSIKGNGKVEGSVPLDPSKPSRAGMPTQLLLGAAGGALGSNDADAPCLLIGLGSGVTLGALVETRERLGVRGRVAVVEIEKAFLDIVRREEVGRFVGAWFDESRLGDRVAWHFGDARRVIARDLARERFSVIVSQPSEPWIVGAAPLFTVEFFREASQRLAPGGCFVQWVQLYRLETESLRLLVGTYQSVFENTMIFRPPRSGEVLLVGSHEPIDLSRLARGTVLRGQAASGVLDAEDWLAAYVAGPTGLREWTSAEPSLPRNSDSRGELEFRAPRFLDLPAAQALANLRALRQVGARDPVSRYLPTEQRTPERLLRLARRNTDPRFRDLSEARALLEGDDSDAAKQLREAIDAAMKSSANGGTR